MVGNDLFDVEYIPNGCWCPLLRDEGVRARFREDTGRNFWNLVSIRLETADATVWGGSAADSRHAMEVEDLTWADAAPLMTYGALVAFAGRPDEWKEAKWCREGDGYYQ